MQRAKSNKVENISTNTNVHKYVAGGLCRSPLTSGLRFSSKELKLLFTNKISFDDIDRIRLESIEKRCKRLLKFPRCVESFQPPKHRQ